MKPKNLFWAVLNWRLLTLSLVSLCVSLLPLKPAFTSAATEYGRGYPYLLSSLANFDGIHYLSISYRGYELLKQPFFPFYPMLIWLTHKISGLSVLGAGLVVSHIAFIATIPVLYWLVNQDLKRNQQYFWLALLFFPSSFFYGATYNDSLFFLCASLTIWLARDRRWWLAGFAAACATLTRLNGLALAIYLVAEICTASLPQIDQTWQPKLWWQNFWKNFSWSEFWMSPFWAAAQIPIAFAGYLLFLQVEFGDWRTLFNTMSIWKQNSATLPPQVIWRYIKIFFTVNPKLLEYWVAIVEFVAVTWYVFLLTWGWKKIRSADWLFAAVSILIPWLTGTFAGMPRYALHLYPLFLLMALWLKQRSSLVQVVYLTTCFLLMIFIIALFTRGTFIT